MLLGNSIIDFFNANKAACISIYVILMLGVVGVTTLLERICLTFKVKAKLSDGIVAGILLGVITSLPECVTCITSIAQSKAGDMGVGDIIGSNFFDLFVMAACLLVCILIFIDKKVQKINIYTLICVAVGTLFVFLGMLFSDGANAPLFPGHSPLVWHGFNFFSIPIILCYAASIVFVVLDAKKQKKNKNDSNFDNQSARKSAFYKLAVPILVILIIVVAAVLITISVFLTYASSSLIQYHWKLGDAFGGAVLLGIVTSLPEIVCCVNLCIHKEYNMVINTMVGSCIFNLSVLTISNVVLAAVISSGSSTEMYAWNTSNLSQVITCAVIIIFCILYLIFNTQKFKAKLTKKGNIALNSVLLSLAIVAFIIFLALGFIYGKQ